MFAPDIIMWRYGGLIEKRQLLIKIFLKDIFNHGVVDPGSLQCPGAGSFEPVGIILFLQHQHAKTGFVILFDINTALQDERSCL